MYPIHLTYHEQTRRLALDDTAVSTGDVGADVILLRTLPSLIREETYHIVFKVLAPAGKGKVEFPSVKLTFDVTGTRRWRATIPPEVLQAVRRSPVMLQLRIGEGKHYYSLNAVQLTATKAIVTK